MPNRRPDHVPGTPCFVNGVVLDGVLHLTDVWRCFLLEEAHRSLLTSVVTSRPARRENAIWRTGCQSVVKGIGLASGPVTFEVVMGADRTLKLVKFAARTPGHPLPHLCALLGLPDQAAALAGGPRALAGRPIEPGFVADYAFAAREGGRLVPSKAWTRSGVALLRR